MNIQQNTLKRLECVGNLPEYKINRAGIQARSYKHSVHKIEMPSASLGGRKKEYYFILEYATPLKTLYDISRHADAVLTGPERAHQLMCGHDPFNENFQKVRSKTEWIGSVQPEKFRKNWSTF